MSGSWIRSLIKQLHDKHFRGAYVAEDIRTGIAFQIRALREQRGLSQAELGALAGGKAQSAIARLEDPDYGRFNLTTLIELASAFDVALMVRFVPFSELIKRNRDLSTAALQVPGFLDDAALSQDIDVTPSASAVTSNVVSLYPSKSTISTASLEQPSGLRPAEGPFAEEAGFLRVETPDASRTS